MNNYIKDLKSIVDKNTKNDFSDGFVKLSNEFLKELLKEISQFKQPLHGEDVSMLKWIHENFEPIADGYWRDKFGDRLSHSDLLTVYNSNKTQPSKQSPSPQNDWELEAEAEELYPYRLPATEPFSSHNAIQEGLRQAHIKAAQLHRNEGLNLLIDWLEERKLSSLQGMAESKTIGNEGDRLEYKGRFNAYGNSITKAKEIQSLINK